MKHINPEMKEIIKMELENIKRYFEVVERIDSEMPELEFINKIEMSNKEVYEYGETLINNIFKGNIPDTIDIKFLDSHSSYIFRNLFIHLIGHGVITKEFATSLKEKVIKNGKCLEIMCGTGCLSKVLQDINVDIIATDNYSINYGFKTRWTDIEEIDCLDAIRKYGKDVDYIISSWIPYNSSLGYEALKLMNKINPNCKMISINEHIGGCNADDDFYDHAIIIESFNNDNRNTFSYNTGEESVSYRTWNGLHDYVSVIQYDKG